MTSVIFEVWLQAICRNKGSQNGRTWRRKYFVLLRNPVKPEVRLYSKKPKSLDGKYNRIQIEDGYQVLRKSAYKGKPLVCHLLTNENEVFLAPDERHLCDFLCFFLRTLSKLTPNSGGCQSFIVRPEKTDDAQRIGCFNSICNLSISRWGMILWLQLSGSILGQWPLRCIRTYECSGQGRFVFEVGHFSPTGSTRLAFKTKAGQDAAIYYLLDDLIEDTARLESVAMDQLVGDQSRERAQREAFLEELFGLCRISEVSVDQSFDAHLKKISRDIHDHLRDNFGERGQSAPLAYEKEGRGYELVSPKSPPLSEPFVRWTTSPASVVSDDVFPEMAPPQKHKLIDYADMQNGTTKNSMEAVALTGIAEPTLDDIVELEPETGECSWVKPQADYSSYIHPDNHCTGDRDKYLSSICCKGNLKEHHKLETSSAMPPLPKVPCKIHKDESRFGQGNIVKKTKTENSDSRVYHSARKTLPHNYFCLDGTNSSIEAFLDVPLEPADYGYFSTNLRLPKDKVPAISQKPNKNKLENILQLENLKVKVTSASRSSQQDVPLVPLANR